MDTQQKSGAGLTAKMSVCVFVCVCVRRPFRPSLSSFSRVSSSLKPVQQLSMVGDNLLKDLTLVGGNESGIFVSSVQSGSPAEKAGLREGHHLLLVRTGGHSWPMRRQPAALGGRFRKSLSCSCVCGSLRDAYVESSIASHWTPALRRRPTGRCSTAPGPSGCTIAPTTTVSGIPLGPLVCAELQTGVNSPPCRSTAFRRLQRDLAEGALASGDSFYIRVNLNVSSQSDSCSLSVHCDEIVHVLDTRYQNRCEWLCTRVDPYSGADLTRPMDRGTIPSNSR